MGKRARFLEPLIRPSVVALFSDAAAVTTGAQAGAWIENDGHATEGKER